MTLPLGQPWERLVRMNEEMDAIDRREARKEEIRIQREYFDAQARKYVNDGTNFPRVER